MGNFRFNPFSGNFIPGSKSAKLSDEEIARIFKKVRTSDVNALGNPNLFYDHIECKWVEAAPQIVVDSDGNIILDDC